MFYIVTCIEPEARRPTALADEMQMTPNVQKVRNLEPEETVTTFGLSIHSYLKKESGSSHGMGARDNFFELQRK